MVTCSLLDTELPPLTPLAHDVRGGGSFNQSGQWRSTVHECAFVELWLQCLSGLVQAPNQKHPTKGP